MKNGHKLHWLIFTLSHVSTLELTTTEAANHTLVQNSNQIFLPYRVSIAAEQAEVNLMKFGRGQFEDVKTTEVQILDSFCFERIIRDSNEEVTEKLPTPMVRVTFPGSGLLPTPIFFRS